MTSADLLAALGKPDADPAHWAELVERHGARLWAVCCAAAGKNLAEDAFQDGLIAIRHSAGRFRPGTDPETSALSWMVTVMHRRAINLVRADIRKQKREGRSMPSEPPAAPAPAGDDDRAAILRLAMQALDRLPERHQQVIRLRLLAGLDAAGTAALLGCPADQVRVRLQRALDLLRRHCASAGLSAGAALPTATGLAQLIQHAATPPIGLPAAAKSLALASFTKPPAVAAGLSLGAIMTYATIGCGALATIILTMSLWPHASAQAVDQPPAAVATAPATAPAVAPGTFVVGHDQMRMVQVSLEFQDDTVADAIATLARLTHVKMTIAPDVPPGNLVITVDHMKLGTTPFVVALSYVSQASGLTFKLNGDGSVTWSKPTPIPQTGVTWNFSGGGIPPEDALYLVNARDVTGADFMRLNAKANGGNPPMVADYGPELTSFRGTILSLSQQERFLEAFVKGYKYFQPYGIWMAKDVDLPAFSGTVDDALALITRLGGVPCRVDTESGPVPRITLPAGRVTCDALFAHIAHAIDMEQTQSADGLVLYRPPFRKYLDLDGKSAPANGKAYRDDHPAWWAYAQSVAKKPSVDVVMDPGDRLITVAWRDIPLKDAADDLHKLTGIPVKVQVDAATAAAPILLVMADRQISDVLICLGQAADCSCTLSDDGAAITLAPSAKPNGPLPTPAPAAPAKHRADL